MLIVVLVVEGGGGLGVEKRKTANKVILGKLARRLDKAAAKKAF
jgi:hypothetical protein